MKLTKSKLKQTIREEIENANWPDANEAKAAELYRRCLKMGPGRKDPLGWHHGGEACIDSLLSLGEMSEEEVNKLRSYILNLVGRWQNHDDPDNPTGEGRYLIVKKSDLPTTQGEMKLTESKLKRIIKEELDDFERFNAPEYQLNDKLVSAASDAIKSAAWEFLKQYKGPTGRPLSPTVIKDTMENIELDIEEPLMDLLLPVARSLQRKTGDSEPEPEGLPWQPDLMEVKIGDIVKHKEYGQGMVAALRSGKGGDRRAVVKWDRKGENRETIVGSLTVVKKREKK